MKRLLPALAAAACLGPNAATAQGSNVTIYGLIDFAARHASNTNAARESATSTEDGIFTGSRLGFRGREDLGGGLSAQFTLEHGFDPSTGASLQGTPSGDYGQVTAAQRMWGRELHLGLRGPWGGVTVGRQYTVAHSLAARFQPQGNPNSTVYSLFSSHHVPRQDNMLKLDGKLGPVDLLASYTFGEQAGDTGANSSWALGVGSTRGALSVAAYVQQLKNLAGSETRKIVGLGGNYRINPTVVVYGGLMRRSAEVSAQRNRAWTLGTNIDLSPTVTLSVAHYDDQQSGSAALDGARSVSWLSVNYRFSKRTDVYLNLDRNDVEDGYAKPAFMGVKGSQNGTAVGLRHRF